MVCCRRLRSSRSSERGTAARSISDDAPTQRPWGWVILGTNVDGQHPSGAPIRGQKSCGRNRRRAPRIT